MTSTRYRLAESVLTVETNGENVLMDYGSGKYFGLRGAIGVVMEPLRNGADFEEMTGIITSHYNVSTGKAEEDLRSILKRLVDAGLIIEVFGVTETEQL